MSLRILALVTEAYGGRGGIAQYNRDALDALAASDRCESIHVLARSVTDVVSGLARGVVQHPPAPGRAAYTMRSLALARNVRPDVIFCGHLYMAPLAALLARWMKCRLVIQIHGIEIWRRPSEIRRRALEAADEVLCVSRDTRARVLATTNLPPEKLRVVPNTVAADFAPGDRIAARRQFGLDDQFALLSVGRLDARERYKGQDSVIACLPDLLKRQPDLVYLIAGEGDDRARLNEMATEKGVADHVRFLGHVARDDLPSLYRAADLFVLPSTGEGFGIVFLEAMACGTPALGLAIGGASDALGDGDLGYAPAPQDLARVLREAVSAPIDDSARLSQRVQDRFGRRIFNGCIAKAAAAWARA